MSSEELSKTEPAPASRGRLVAGLVALVSIPVLLLSDLGWSISRGWKTESRVDLLAIAAAATVLLLVGLLVLWPRSRRAIARSYVQLTLLVSVLALTWLLGEAALNVLPIGIGEEPFHRRRPNMTMVLHPDPEAIRGVASEATFHANSLGIRGSEFPARDEALRVLCIGGSATECLYLDEPKSWPGLLAKQLNPAPSGRPVWVGNCGKSGYAGVHHLQFVNESELMSEVDCLLMMVGINDLRRFLANEEPAAETAAREAREKALQEDTRPFWSYSAVRALARDAINVYAAQYANRSEDVRGHAYMARRAERNAAEKSSNLPNLDRPIREYQERIAAIIEATKSKGVRLVAIAQPVLWTKDLPPDLEELNWMGDTKDGGFLATPQLAEGMDRFNDALLETCREHGIETIDLRSMNGQAPFFYDDCHFTEVGAQHAADLITAWFAEHPLDSSESSASQPAPATTATTDAAENKGG